jgi:hypothetical protein
MNWTRTGLLMIVLICMAAPVALNASSSGAALIYMLIEPSARAGGMGKAYVAQVDDAFANYWNPGALAFNRKTQVAAMHTNWFGGVQGIDDMYLEYLAWDDYFEDIGTLGAHVIYMTYGDQPRTGFQGEDLGMFSSWDVCAAFSYANLVRPSLGLGATFKFFYSYLAPEGTGQSETDQKGDGMSWAFDFGVKSRGVDVGQVAVAPYNGALAAYNGVTSLFGGEGVKYSDFSAPIPRLDFGLNIQNLGPDITYINKDQADPLPLNWRMGFSYRLLGPLTPPVQDPNSTEKGPRVMNRMTINADMNKVLANDDNPLLRLVTAWKDDPMDQEIEETIFTCGAEYVYYDLIALRGGYYYDKYGHMTGPCFGVGVTTSINKYDLGVDFAMVEGGDLDDYNKLFSFTLNF